MPTLSRKAGTALRKQELIRLTAFKTAKATVVDDGPDTTDLEILWEIEQWWLGQLSRALMAAMSTGMRYEYMTPKPFVPAPAPDTQGIFSGLCFLARSTRKVRILARVSPMTGREFAEAVEKAGGRII